tara:strand:+ start:321 stop:1190 length:870 start_codon:yes stop_codon:yes gene_type:complete
MKNWLIFIKERIPVVVYALLVGGITSSSFIFGNIQINLKEAPLFLLGFFGLFLAFAILRMMDEVKDFEKDKVAHPDRPLPRGLLKVDQVLGMIKFIYIFMVILSIALIFFKSIQSGLCYLVITIWLGLMYKEFFIPKWLNERPLIYAISHQILMLAVAAFPALLYNQSNNYGTIIALGTTILGSFFTYEVCRKLDPKADPILGTYLVTYGPFNTFTIVLGTSVVAWIGALQLGYFPILASFQLLCVISFLLIFFRPLKYKIVEGIATLSLVIHLWCGPISLLINFKGGS